MNKPLIKKAYKYNYLTNYMKFVCKQLKKFYILINKWLYKGCLYITKVTIFLIINLNSH